MNEGERRAFRAGWMTNAAHEQGTDYLDKCEAVDWQEYQKRGHSDYLNSLQEAAAVAPATKGGEDELRRAWEYGRTSWCPAGILRDKERTERDWREALAALSAQDTDGVAK